MIDGSNLNQNLGSVVTKSGRAICFPNLYQHQVSPFELADKSKPGHRKIVALFLVDPNIRVISTASVPCQRMDWWKEECTAHTTDSSGLRPTSLLHTLPVELLDQTFDQLDKYPISLEEAKELRLELMEERKKFVLDNQKAVEERTFSLCEH